MKNFLITTLALAGAFTAQANASDMDDIKFYTENAAAYNCLSFALKNRDGVWGHPGAASGHPIRSLNYFEFLSALKRDGFVPAQWTSGKIPPAREGYYLVAAVIADGQQKGRAGFHFYRQMEHGSWWHKAGKKVPTNLDANETPITNPEIAAKDYTKRIFHYYGWQETTDNWQLNYNFFAGYFYVPNAGLSVAPGGLPDEVMMPKPREEESEKFSWQNREVPGFKSKSFGY